MDSRTDLWSEVSSDAELITAARAGDPAAFGALYERHAAAGRTVARQYVANGPDAEDVVADAFARVFAKVREGGGPDVAFRAYLFTVVRRLAFAGVRSGRRVAPTDDLDVLEAGSEWAPPVEDPTIAGFERGVVARAYASLPERWQAVLWYTEIERLQPAQIAPLLGLSPNGVAALSYRAREALRQAYLQQHLAAPRSDGCRVVNGKLGSYVRGGLAKRETAQVRAHLQECGDCRALVLELGDVNHGMRAVIAPLVLGLAGLGALAQPLPVGGIAAWGAGTAAAVGSAAGASAAVGGGVAGGAASGVTALGAGAGAGAG
ncbi:sigma-70 family RNA polymerase sigma factor, partial [Cellulomonas fimi]